jgi:hypothetical protein
MYDQAFQHGERDYSKGRCVVYRSVRGTLMWDTEDQVGVDLADRLIWAEAYIAGYQHATETAEKDLAFQQDCNR